MKKQDFEKLLKTGTTKEKALYLHNERKKGTLKEEEQEAIEASIPEEEKENFIKYEVYSATYANFFPTFTVVYFSAVCSHFCLRNLLQIVHDEERIVKDIKFFIDDASEEFNPETLQKILQLLQKNLSFETIKVELTETPRTIAYNDYRELFKEQIEKATNDLISLKSCILALQFYADGTDTEDFYLSTFGKHIKIISEDWAEEYYDGEFSQRKLDRITRTKKPITPEMIAKGVIPYFMGVEESEEQIKKFLQAIMRSQDKFTE